jgi:hypothetical protein
MHVDNPTGDCSAPNDGSRSGYHAPEKDDVWVPDCESPLSREYYRVFATGPDSAYVIPRPDGSPYLSPVCANPQHALRALADRYTLCGAVDVELVNSMKVDDALSLTHFLHQSLVFVASEQGVTPGALSSDILDACESDPAFRSGPLAERCEFEIEAKRSGRRDEIGWIHTGEQAEALAEKMNELYGISPAD